MPDFPKAYSTAEYLEADTQPKASAQELKYWWLRDTTQPRYYPYIVKRVDDRTEDGERWFYFQLARREDLKDPGNPSAPAVFKVELTQQFKLCWPDLPSTAQLTTPERPYGFLMLSADWEGLANTYIGNSFNVSLLQEDGKKWPISAFTSPRQRLLELLQDETLEDVQLFEALNYFMKSLR